MSLPLCDKLTALGRTRHCSRPAAKPADTPPAADSATPALDTDEEKVVNVYNWSDYIEPTVIEAFEKETGIKVNYEVMDSNEVLETKLLAGRTGYDVVVPSASFLARQIKAGIYQKLDKTKLTNYRQPRSGRHQAPGGLRSRQRARGELHVGHLGRRLQRGQDQRSHAERPGRQLRRCSGIRR